MVDRCHDFPIHVVKGKSLSTLMIPLCTSMNPIGRYPTIYAYEINTRQKASNTSVGQAAFKNPWTLTFKKNQAQIDNISLKLWTVSDRFNGPANPPTVSSTHQAEQSRRNRTPMLFYSSWDICQWYQPVSVCDHTLMVYLVAISCKSFTYHVESYKPSVNLIIGSIYRQQKHRQPPYWNSHLAAKNILVA